MSDKTCNTPSASPRKRLKKGERRQKIIDDAIVFFAEQGFDASTRQFADYAGIAQPLLYNYFPSKDALVEAVYEQVYVDQWRPEWDQILADRTRPIADRLNAFYLSYVEIIHDPEWMRLYLQAGLKSLDINRWYIALVEERVIRRIIRELRVEHNAPDEAQHPITPGEIEMVWTFHGGLFYHGVRREIFGVERMAPGPVAIDTSIRMLIAGSADVMTGLT